MSESESEFLHEKNIFSCIGARIHTQEGLALDRLDIQSAAKLFKCLPKAMAISVLSLLKCIAKFLPLILLLRKNYSS